MDKNARKILFIAVYAIGLFVLVMAMWSLFADFTIGKSAYDVSSEAEASVAEAGKYAYWLSGAGFFILLPFAVGTLLTCFIRRLSVSVLTAVYGLLAFVALIVITAVVGGLSYDDNGEVLENVCLVVSAFQVELMWAMAPVVLLSIFAVIISVKNKTAERIGSADAVVAEKTEVEQ